MVVRDAWRFQGNLIMQRGKVEDANDADEADDGADDALINRQTPFQQTVSKINE